MRPDLRPPVLPPVVDDLERIEAAARAVGPGGTVVCAGIHMSDIPAFPYSDLWNEREIVSVANLTRQDGSAFERLLDQSFSPNKEESNE